MYWVKIGWTCISVSATTVVFETQGVCPCHMIGINSVYKKGLNGCDVTGAREVSKLECWTSLDVFSLR